MSKINIFDLVDYETSYDYFKFVEVGDKVQGTYVSRNDRSVDGYQNPQTLVGLLQEDGTVKTISIRHTKVGLLEELDKVRLGQIIGFTFTGTKDNPGKQPTKFIKLVHDPKYIDETWLTEYNKRQAELANPTAGMTVEQIFPTEPVAPAAIAATAVPTTPTATTISTSELEASLAVGSPESMTDSEKIMEIASLAKTKLGALTTEEVKVKVLEKTGLEFSVANLNQIMAKLQAL